MSDEIETDCGHECSDPKEDAGGNYLCHKCYEDVMNEYNEEKNAFKLLRKSIENNEEVLILLDKVKSGELGFIEWEELCRAKINELKTEIEKLNYEF